MKEREREREREEKRRDERDRSPYESLVILEMSILMWPLVPVWHGVHAEHMKQ